MSTSSGFFVHTMEALYATALYADYAVHYTCAYIQVYRTRAITSVVYGRNTENELVSRIKMANYSELVSMGTL